MQKRILPFKCVSKWKRDIIVLHIFNHPFELKICVHTKVRGAYSAHTARAYDEVFVNVTVGVKLHLNYVAFWVILFVFIRFNMRVWKCSRCHLALCTHMNVWTIQYHHHQPSFIHFHMPKLRIQCERRTVDGEHHGKFEHDMKVPALVFLCVQQSIGYSFCSQFLAIIVVKGNNISNSSFTICICRSFDLWTFI